MPRTNKNVYSLEEERLFKKLTTPAKIQDFINTLSVNFEERGDTCMSPREVLKYKKAQCMEGSLLAAAILEFHGNQPLLLDLKSNQKDFDHVVALFKKNGYWGAISKTNHVVLRYREPVYKTIRELALSYFHEYFLDDGKKTLLSYSKPFSLSRYKTKKWQIDAEPLWHIPEALDDSPHTPIVPKAQRALFRKADPIEIEAGKLVVQKLQKRHLTKK